MVGSVSANLTVSLPSVRLHRPWLPTKHLPICWSRPFWWCGITHTASGIRQSSQRFRKFHKFRKTLLNISKFESLLRYRPLLVPWYLHSRAQATLVNSHRTAGIWINQWVLGHTGRISDSQVLERHVLSWRMLSSEAWRRVVLVRADVSEEHITSVIKVKGIIKLGTTLSGNMHRISPPSTQAPKYLGASYVATPIQCEEVA
jgi:hypothetical protein